MYKLNISLKVSKDFTNTIKYKVGRYILFRSTTCKGGYKLQSEKVKSIRGPKHYRITLKLNVKRLLIITTHKKRKQKLTQYTE